MRIGTRRSVLALAQTQWVVDQLRAAGHDVEVIEIGVSGDDTTRPVSELGVDAFVNGLRSALVSGQIDAAVHSFKDLPTEVFAATVVAAVPLRADARDALVARDGLTLGELPAGSRVGTGSARRTAQLTALGLDLDVVPIRGNVDSRIARVGIDLDAVVVAAAGLFRMSRAEVITEMIDPLQMLPAPAQGALAIEVRADDAQAAAVVAYLDDPVSRACAVAERAMLERLGAGCSAAVGALAEVVEGDDGEELWLRGVALAADGWAVRLSQTGAVDQPTKVGHLLADKLLEDGAAHLLQHEAKRVNQ